MSISKIPNPNVDIFNNEYWLSSSNPNDLLYVKYPIAQGNVTFPQNVVVNSNLNVHNNTTIDNNLTVSGKIIFDDNTEQSTAFTNLDPNPANTYNNPSQIVVNSKGQITNVTTGGSSFTPITLTSTASSTNSWIINTTSLDKKYYQFYLYSTNGFASNTVTNYTEYSSVSTPTTNGLVLSGLLSRVPVTVQTGTNITYCAGFQQNYSWNKNVYGYLPSKINNFSTSVDIVSKINGVEENDNTCPPTAGNWSGCQLEISIESGSDDLTSSSTLTLVCYSLD